MSAYVDDSVGVITAINPHVGYETAARVAREAIVEGTPVREIVLRAKMLSREQITALLARCRVRWRKAVRRRTARRHSRPVRDEESRQRRCETPEGGACLEGSGPG